MTFSVAMRRPISVFLSWILDIVDIQEKETQLPLFMRLAPLPEPVREIVIIGYKNGQQTYEVVDLSPAAR
jgi:hypothetical protein